MRNGVLQDWGLVEFFDADEAEITQTQLHGHNINGHKIRVQYCIPGVNAINIYMSVVNAPETSKKGLIDEAPNSAVYTQLQKLSTQNPACEYTTKPVFLYFWWKKSFLKMILRAK